MNDGAGIFAGSAGGIRAPRKNTAVMAVLGKDFAQKLRRGGGEDYAAFNEKEKGEIDVKILLAGAEKLCSV